MKEIEENFKEDEIESFQKKRYRNVYIPSKPCSYGFKKFFREYAKKFYKSKKAEEREVGRKINKLVQELHHERRNFGKGNVEENKEYLNSLLKELMELRKIPKFKQEFPSFSAFFTYVKKEKLTYNDLRELENGTDS